jgi:hypothetical protein
MSWVLVDRCAAHAAAQSFICQLARTYRLRACSQVSARLREALKSRLAASGGSGSGSGSSTVGGLGAQQLSPLQHLSPRECSTSNGAALAAVHELE